MEKTCTIQIIDQVNIKLNGLDAHIRREIVEKLKFLVPYARFLPQFKLGRWDGKISFASVGGGTYINLLDRVLPIIIDAGYEIKIDDRRPEYNFSFPKATEDMLSDKVWPIGHPMAGQPILLRDYQVKAINNFLENHQSLQSIATGSGKTILTATLSYLCEPYGRTIVIVPSKSLVKQTEEDYINLGLDVGVFFGDRKEWNKTHTICTWQSLSILGKKTKKEEIDVSIGVDEFLKDVVCVIVDETHIVKGNQLRDLLCGSMAEIPIRWGLTGTIPKEEHEFLCLLISLGSIVGDGVKASDLQEKGVLSNCHINILQLQDSHVDYNDWHDELEYLTTDRKRLEWIAKRCEQISNTGNTLILVDRIECGEFLQSLLPNSVFISGSMSVKNRTVEYKSIQTENNKVLVCTYGCSSTGLNLPRIFNLILFEPGKAFTKIIQSVGRSLRKTDDKDFANIYDICSSLKYSKRHLTKRKQYYNEAEYPYTMEKIKYR